MKTFTEQLKGETEDGVAYVFVRENGGPWSEEAQLTDFSGAPDDDRNGETITIVKGGER